MLADLILAIAHHLLMFALLSLLVMEMMLARPGLKGGAISRLSAYDLAYGTVAGLVLAVGFARVYFGLKGPDYYLSNPFFWAKICAFLAVGLLSIPPTMRVLAWRRTARTDPGFSPDIADIVRVRRFMHLEATVFVLIPIFAALMARGYEL